MKRSLIVGLFAGFVAGLVKAALYVGVLWGLFSYFLYPALDVPGMVILYVLHTTLWGIVFGALYDFFYDYIPGVGIKKGLVYGLILWVTTIVHMSVITIIYGLTEGFQDFIAGFFSLCLVYGPLLGILYKKE
jgi:uncharacterized membrane protein YagU involved in acid resistance